MALPECGIGSGSNIFCKVVATARGEGGDPVKPTYYLEAWVVLPIVIVAFLVGRLSRRKS